MLRNFSWVISRRLAGMALPTGAYWVPGVTSDYTELEQDLLDLKNQGIVAVVSLTHTPLHPETMRRCDLKGLHLPVDDMAAPSVEQMVRVAEFIDRHTRRGGVVVHCNAGIGRTGTMLAAYMVWTGLAPDHAIETVRRHRPGSIETAQQETAVYAFADRIQRHKKADSP
jgi:atypical dual specificity phosphatase